MLAIKTCVYAIYIFSGIWNFLPFNSRYTVHEKSPVLGRTNLTKSLIFNNNGFTNTQFVHNYTINYINKISVPLIAALKAGCHEVNQQLILNVSHAVPWCRVCSSFNPILELIFGMMVMFFVMLSKYYNKCGSNYQQFNKFTLSPGLPEIYQK